MSRTNVSKLMFLTKKLERRKAKIERRIDNLKREYVNILSTLDSMDKRVIELLPKEAKKEEPKPSINIPVIPEDANLQSGQ